MAYVILLWEPTYIVYSPAFPGKYYLYTDADIVGSDLNGISLAGVQCLVLTPIIDAVGDFLIDAEGDYICAVV